MTEIEHVNLDCSCSGFVCTQCKNLLCYDRFHKQGSGRDGYKRKGYRSTYKVCRRKYENNRKREYTRKNRGRIAIRDTNRRMLYIFTIEEWNELHKKQNGLCAICDKTLDKGKNTHLDHCHSTGKVRGLLCRNCNLALGHFSDNAELIQRAYQYLLERQ